MVGLGVTTTEKDATKDTGRGRENPYSRTAACLQPCKSGCPGCSPVKSQGAVGRAVGTDSGETLRRILISMSLSSTLLVHTWVLQTNVLPRSFSFLTPECGDNFDSRIGRETGFRLWAAFLEDSECSGFLHSLCLQSHAAVRTLKHPSCSTVTSICLTSYPFLSTLLALWKACNRLHLDFISLQHPQAFPAVKLWVQLWNWQLEQAVMFPKTRQWLFLGYVLAMCGNSPPSS